MRNEWVHAEFKNPDDRGGGPAWSEILEELDEEDRSRAAQAEKEKAVRTARAEAEVRRREDEAFRKRIVIGASCADHHGDRIAEARERAVSAFVTLLRSWRSTFRKLVEEKRLSPEMMGLMQEKGMDYPSLRLLSGTEAVEHVQGLGLPYEGGGDSLVAAFNLPKQMAYGWWKGGTEEWGDRSVDVRGMVIEWGWFYRRMMPEVWDATDQAPGVQFLRINPPGVHDPRKYYYVWDVSSVGTEDGSEG